MTGDVQVPDGDRDVETVAALLEREIADDVASNIRHARANVRCLDCGIRYEERQDYPCGEPGFGHDGFTDEMLADAEAEGRAEPIEYVTLSVADLRAALASQPAQSERERVQANIAAARAAAIAAGIPLGSTQPAQSGDGVAEAVARERERIATAIDGLQSTTIGGNPFGDAYKTGFDTSRRLAARIARTTTEETDHG